MTWMEESGATSRRQGQIPEPPPNRLKICPTGTRRVGPLCDRSCREDGGKLTKRRQGLFPSGPSSDRCWLWQETRSKRKTRSTSPVCAAWSCCDDHAKLAESP